jgi:hypothetical protein
MESIVVVMKIEYRPPTPKEFLEFREDVRNLLAKMTWRLGDRDDELRTVPLEEYEQRDVYLAVLNAVGVTNAILDTFEKEAAHRAGRLGASYPELASAWRVTRQGARRRWPNSVPGPDDRSLRRALTAVVLEVSNSPTLDPGTAACLIGPVTAAAMAQAGSSAEAVAEAAAQLLAAPPPAPADAGIIGPLLDRLKAQLDDYQSGGVTSTPDEASPWQRFLGAPNQ